MTLLGLDIGGANIKAATADGEAVSVPFELWKTPEKLTEKLTEVAGMFPVADQVGVTMTGELCDCFETKAEGVVHIVDACLQVFDESKLLFWLVEAGFAGAAAAKAHSRKTAASNWHALASFVGTLYPDEDVLLVDIGSTTTDIIRVRNGEPDTEGKTDEERLRAGELIYFGVGRTPVAMLDSSNDLCREYFAGTLDCFLLLGRIEEKPDYLLTADGRPASKHHAHNRLARMLGGDRDSIPIQDATLLADRIYSRMFDSLRDKLLGLNIQRFVLSGAGEFLSRNVLDDSIRNGLLEAVPVESLQSKLGPNISESAPAYAVARLLKKHLNQ